MEDDSYEGQAFHPSFGNHVAQGRLALLDWTLQFKSEECEIEMPFQDLEIQLHPREERLSFHHRQYPEWVIYTSASRILDHRAFTSRTHLRNQIQAFPQPSSWRNALAVTVGCLLVFALASILFTWGTGQMVRVIAAGIPAGWEKDYGEKIFAEYKGEMKESTNSQMAAQLKQATDPLLRVVKREFQFHLVENPIPNASAWPGGHVIVHTGMLKLVDTPEQLAGALAHEMAHVTEKHHFRQTISDRGPYYVTRLFFNKRGLANTLAVGSHFLLRQNYSRAYEREADAVGWGYLVAANINPRGEIELLQKLKSEEEKWGVAGATESPFSSHPPSEERIQRLEARWKKMKRQTGFMEFEKPGGIAEPSDR